MSNDRGGFEQRDVWKCTVAVAIGFLAGRLGSSTSACDCAYATVANGTHEESGFRRRRRKRKRQRGMKKEGNSFFSWGLDTQWIGADPVIFKHRV